MKTAELVEKFRQIFGSKGSLYETRAPGRVNLSGAHTDYNQGLVMPVTVDRYVVIIARPRSDRRVRLFSLNFEDEVEFSLDDIRPSKRSFWANYPKGVAKILQESGLLLSGLDALIWGNIPIGGGMSSSAALEVASAYAFLAVSDFNIVPRDLARLCQKAENEFVGMRCGIMDQFAIIFGKKGSCILLDCRSLDYERITLPENIRIVVCNTMVKHELSDSLYNQRRQECEEGVKVLKKYIPGIKSLRDVSLADLRKHVKRLPPTIRKRCLHVVNEIRRTRLGAKKLKNGDLKGFGSLMFASHKSSRDLFESSSPELDLLVKTAGRVKGVLGARLTGAGFGGCTVNLLEEKALPIFKEEITRAYEQEFKRIPDIYVCKTSPGTSVRQYNILKEINQRFARRLLDKVEAKAGK